MVRIGVSGNTDIPCFEVIKSKGYSISAKIYLTKGNKIEDSVTEFTAEKDGNKFLGTLEEVLGLIAMWECRSQIEDDWRASSDEGNAYRQIIREAVFIDEFGNIIDEEKVVF